MTTQWEESDVSKEILGRLNIKYKGTGNQVTIKCPVHDDKHPSCSVNLEKGMWHCFSCGGSGSLRSLYYKETGTSITKELGIPRKIFVQEEEVDLSAVPKIDFMFCGHLEDAYSEEHSKAWAEKRGFSKEFCKNNGIQFCPNFKTVKKSDAGNEEFFSFYSNCIVIPIYEDHGLISFEARDVLGKEAFEKKLIMKGKDPKEYTYKKVLYPKNSSVNTLFQWEKLNRDETLYVTEGLMDMFSLRTSKVFKNSTCMFHNTPTERQIFLFKKFKNIVYIIDNDLPGMNGCLRLMKAIPGKVSFLRPPTRKTIKDINDILQGKDPYIKTVDDLIRMGWLDKVNNRVEDLQNIINVFSK